MIQTEKIYQSILSQLGHLPTDYLQQIDLYLQNLMKEIQEKEERKAKILALAGAWKDMPEKDFNDFLEHNKQLKNNIFNKDTNL
jgi:putative N-acetylmannosamine-6-phosphate epimerase